MISPRLSEHDQYLADLETQAKVPVPPNFLRRESKPRLNLNHVFDPETATARGESLHLEGAIPMSDPTPEPEISTEQALENFCNDAYRLHVLLDCVIDKVRGSEASALVGLSSELAKALSERINLRTSLEMRNRHAPA